MRHIVVDEVETAEGRIVRVEHRPVAPWLSQYAVVGISLEGMQVEDQQQVAALEGQDLVAVVQAALYGCLLQEMPCLADQMDHGLVESLQFVVLQVVVVGQAPLPAGVFVRPTVAFAGANNKRRFKRLW